MKTWFTVSECAECFGVNRDTIYAERANARGGSDHGTDRASV
jgi:hypothetical protein